MDLLASTVSSMAHSMKAMQVELKEFKIEKINASWDHIKDMSSCNNSVASVIHPVLNSSPNGLVMDVFQPHARLWQKKQSR